MVSLVKNIQNKIHFHSEDPITTKNEEKMLCKLLHFIHPQTTSGGGHHLGTAPLLVCDAGEMANGILKSWNKIVMH